MPSQTHKTRQTTKRAPQETQEHEAPESQVDDEGIDDLLEEIDDVLEENAEEFVKSYVQKGGQ